MLGKLREVVNKVRGTEEQPATEGEELAEDCLGCRLAGAGTFSGWRVRAVPAVADT